MTNKIGFANNLTSRPPEPTSRAAGHHGSAASSTWESYLYVSPDGTQVGVLRTNLLTACTERHKVDFPAPALKPTINILSSLQANANHGVVLESSYGIPTKAQLTWLKACLDNKQKAIVYWPKEKAIEVITAQTLPTYQKLRFFYRWTYFVRVLRRLFHYHRPDSNPPDLSVQETKVDNIVTFRETLKPILFKNLRNVPTKEIPISGCGIYLRTDFWAKINAGGSYGHTCYVAKELSKSSESFVAFMPHRYDLLDELGVKQVVLPKPSEFGDEEVISQATDHYYRHLKEAVAAARPSYIYERLCLGNYAGARLSKELSIPYIVEYNGSEISMKHSFDGQGYKYEALYLQAEAAAFEQATVISVVSEPIKESLIRRGVPPAKILVNFNGADPLSYAPPLAKDKAQLRSGFGWNPENVVIGFSGTFGKWHGIDVLAAAIPQICRLVPAARFLLIGSGHCKSKIDAIIKKHKLAPKVKCVGLVPQKEGARLLGACDIFVSPHNAHMIDSRFFGSPTKIFEYMAMGGAIVASNLEQIGEVLSPAVSLEQLRNPQFDVTNERAVLCTPGHITEFVDAVVRLSKKRNIQEKLGLNSRTALLEHYSWEKHVARLWSFACVSAVNLERSGNGPGSSAPKGDSSCISDREPILHPAANGTFCPTPHLSKLSSEDAYKSETQKQWNYDPCGSHYVKKATRNTLAWYKEAERYRYQVYAPWMRDMMEFERHSGKEVLEIGGGIGTDLAQFAAGGAQVTDIDLSHGHLELARENFCLRKLDGKFCHHDAERLPFDTETFDVVYSNGVIHHTPNTKGIVDEIYRVLKPHGKAIIMVYAQSSFHYWYKLVWQLGLWGNLLCESSIGEIMSRHVELGSNGAKPLVKVYTRQTLDDLFQNFQARQIFKRQLIRKELPILLKWLPLNLCQRFMGWNLIIKAVKGIQT